MNYVTGEKVVLDAIGTGGIVPPMRKNLTQIGYLLLMSLMIVK